MTPQIVPSLLIESRRTSPPAWPPYLWTVLIHFLFPSVNSYQDRHKIGMRDPAFRHLLGAVLMGISACRLQVPVQATRGWLFNSLLTSSSPKNSHCSKLLLFYFSPWSYGHPTIITPNLEWNMEHLIWVSNKMELSLCSAEINQNLAQMGGFRLPQGMCFQGCSLWNKKCDNHYMESK